MKIVITKVDHRTSVDQATGITFNRYWEIEYRVLENDASVYLTGNYTFMDALPSEEDMGKAIKESLMNILKQLI